MWITSGPVCAILNHFKRICDNVSAKSISLAISPQLFLQTSEQHQCHFINSPQVMTQTINTVCIGDKSTHHLNSSLNLNEYVWNCVHVIVSQLFPCSYFGPLLVFVCLSPGTMALFQAETVGAERAALLCTEGPRLMVSSPAPCISSTHHRTARCVCVRACVRMSVQVCFLHALSVC